MKIIKFEIFDDEIYAMNLFGYFIDFRQWYYIYTNGIKSESWFDWGELMDYIRDTKESDRIYFEPIPKRKTMFKRY